MTALLRRTDRGTAVAKARQVADQLGLSHPLLASIEVIAFRRGPIVVEQPISGARARLVKIGVRALIVVSNRLSGSPRRFAIAHELGHHELHDGERNINICTNEDLRKRDQSKEGEANAFAAELLMPRSLVEPMCQVARPALSAPSQIAEAFEVSLPAAALRFTELSAEACAVVVCKKGRIEWAFPGPGFRGAPQKGAPVQASSLAYDYFAGRPLRGDPEEVPGDAWLEDARVDEVVEHTVGLTAESTLTLLWQPVADEDEDDE